MYQSNPGVDGEAQTWAFQGGRCQDEVLDRTRFLGRALFGRLNTLFEEISSVRLEIAR